VQQDLAKLRAQDLVRSQRDGNRVKFTANREHPLFAPISEIVLKTTGVVGVLGRALGEEPILCAFVFGSLPKGEATGESDIDLFVVGDVTVRSLTSKLTVVTEQVGRDVNPFVLSQVDFGERLNANDHFVTSVLAEPRWFVVGSEDVLAELG